MTEVTVTFVPMWRAQGGPKEPPKQNIGAAIPFTKKFLILTGEGFNRNVWAHGVAADRQTCLVETYPEATMDRSKMQEEAKKYVDTKFPDPAATPSVAHVIVITISRAVVQELAKRVPAHMIEGYVFTREIMKKYNQEKKLQVFDVGQVQSMDDLEA